MTKTESARGRWIDFAEIDNVRDLGGLPVTGGGTTRFGVVYRASTPQHLTAEDLTLLLGPIGLRTLIDLRNPEEVAAEGYGRLAGTAVHTVNLPVRKALMPDGTPADLVPIGTSADMIRMYTELLSGSVASVLAALRLITDGSRHSIVFHCAAGKDRTGLLTGVLLEAVGVPAVEIAADYALSADRIDRIHARLDALPSYHGLPPARTGIMAADPEIMLGFLDGLGTGFGGAAGWLLANGFTAAELTALRAVLVEPPR